MARRMTPRGHRVVRDATDWHGLYHEGLRMELGGELGEGVTLVAPFTHDRELLVVMVPVPRNLIGTLRQAVDAGAQLVRSAGGLLSLLTGRF